MEVKPGIMSFLPMGEALAVSANRSGGGGLPELANPGALVAEYYERFPARGKRREIYGKEVQKKAQEVARYVLPVATFAYLYHTISGLTLLRYYRMALQEDAPLEQRIVLEKMVQELLRLEPDYRVILQEPIPREETTESRLRRQGQGRIPSGQALREGVRRSALGTSSRSCDARRSTKPACPGSPGSDGIPGEMSDDDAIAWVMDPSKTPI
jgi:hypothetical protein